MIVRWFKWLAGRVLRLMPESLLGRILPDPFGFDASRVPGPPVPSSASTRLMIAPVNYAGQAYQWALAARTHLPDVHAVNMVVRVRGDFQHPADEVVPLGFYAASRRWQRERFEAVAGGFTHAIVEAERQPFGALLDESTEQQVRRLVARGVSVAMLCHGTDIRLPSRHMASFPSSPFFRMPPPLVQRLEATARRNRRLLDELGLPVFVSTPDLLADVPYATWLPVIVEVDRWRTGAPPLERAIPVVVHAPSSGPMKGSESIDPILRGMHDEGRIVYRRIEHVPFEAMFDAYREADIVVDQFAIASYGVAACEAMAAGRVVVSHVSESAREEVLRQHGRRLPIVQATASELEAVLGGVLEDRDAARVTASDGYEFVEEVHDGRRSAEMLASFLR